MKGKRYTEEQIIGNAELNCYPENAEIFRCRGRRLDDI